MWLFRLWWWALPVFPRYLRGIRDLERTAAAEPARAAPARSPRELSDLIRAEAHRIGLTSVGFTAFDPRYAYVEKRGGYDEGSVIVCVLEEDFDAEQRAPSRRHERATFEAYTEIFAMMARLARFVHGLGFRAQPHDIEGPVMYIPLAAQAGLGQMGYNGQLLTPGAGARNILAAITTNAALAHDEPVDYGIPGICSQCRVCIRRCPVGALPGAPSEHRGVTKTKLKTERCLPVVAQADGCAVCAKTCPVQRYGLSAVLAHLDATGEILGKGSAELETFEWPLDGRAYGPGEKPRVNSAELLHPAGLEFDIRALTRPFAKETT
jgi:epoxyqueuosine reductase QueG